MNEEAGDAFNAAARDFGTLSECCDDACNCGRATEDQNGYWNESCPAPTPKIFCVRFLLRSDLRHVLKLA